MDEWRGKTVLVTGGNGFLGSHMVRLLSDLGATTFSVTRQPVAAFESAGKAKGTVKTFQIDLLDSVEIRAFCETRKPYIDVLIHCAGVDGNLAFKMGHPADIVTENVQLASNVLEAARLGEIKDVVVISSAEIYSGIAKSPLQESDDFTAKFPFPSNGYVLSKVIVEILGQVYSMQYGLRVYLPRPTNLYGPGDSSGVDRGRVIPAMLSKILNSGIVDIWGDGKQSRSFMHVEDAARAILLMVSKQRVGPLNIATSEVISIEGLADTIFKLAGKPKRIACDNSKPVGQKNRILSVQLLYEILDFEPRSLSQGLKDTINWYVNESKIASLGSISPDGNAPVKQYWYDRINSSGTET